MNHQRRLHTLVSHVYGSDQPVTFAGAPVKSIIPAAAGEAGNTTLTDGLQAELALLTGGNT
jgi:hypothetical protein